MDLGGIPILDPHCHARTGPTSDGFLGMERSRASRPTERLDVHFFGRDEDLVEPAGLDRPDLETCTHTEAPLDRSDLDPSIERPRWIRLFDGLLLVDDQWGEGGSVDVDLAPGRGEREEQQWDEPHRHAAGNLTAHPQKSFRRRVGATSGRASLVSLLAGRRAMTATDSATLSACP